MSNFKPHQKYQTAGILWRNRCTEVSGSECVLSVSHIKFGEKIQTVQQVKDAANRHRELTRQCLFLYKGTLDAVRK
jgi:hypothetical protein